jgi:hypothetical protein
MKPFHPRSISFLRLQSHRGWQVKLYSIALEAPVVDESRFRGGLEFALDALPDPARSMEREGVAFCILHQGRGIDYTVLAWWDRENEMPLRVFVRDGGADWRPAQGAESVCVWDLQVIAFERDRYVETILADPALPVEAYLSRTMSAPIGDHVEA